MAARSTVIPRKSTKPAEPQLLPVQERVRQRAYELYLQRGGADGAELDDWLQAEEEIAAQTRTSSPA